MIWGYSSVSFFTAGFLRKTLKSIPLGLFEGSADFTEIEVGFNVVVERGDFVGGLEEAELKNSLFPYLDIISI